MPQNAISNFLVQYRYSFTQDDFGQTELCKEVCLAKIFNNRSSKIFQADGFSINILSSIFHVFGQKISPGMAECGSYRLDRQASGCFIVSTLNNELCCIK